MKKVPKIEEYVKTREPREVFSVKVRPSIIRRMEQIKNKKSWTWVDLVEGVFERFLDEQEK
jgi:hypothetical protein